MSGKLYQATKADILADAPIVEIYHHAPRVVQSGQQGAGAISQMLQEHARLVDPIGVARRVEEGRYYLVKVEPPE